MAGFQGFEPQYAPIGYGVLSQRTDLPIAGVRVHDRFHFLSVPLSSVMDTALERQPTPVELEAYSCFNVPRLHLRS